MIDLNVRALTDFSLAFLDSLERRKGGILNVASVAGFLPGPGMAVYYATKAYVISFSEALHHELKPKGVRVTVLCPGPVPTEFQARAGINQRGVSAAADAFRRAGRAGRLSRAQRGPPHGGPGFRQQVMARLTRVIRSAAAAADHAGAACSRLPTCANAALRVRRNCVRRGH